MLYLELVLNKDQILVELLVRIAQPRILELLESIPYMYTYHFRNLHILEKKGASEIKMPLAILLWSTWRTYHCRQCGEKGTPLSGSTALSHQWHCAEKNTKIIHLVCVYTGSVGYVTDSDKIESYDIMNTIKQDPSKLKSKQSIQYKLAKHTMPATRFIARMQARLRQHLHQKQSNHEEEYSSP